MTDLDDTKFHVYISDGLDPWVDDSWVHIDDRELTPRQKLAQAELVDCEVLGDTCGLKT